MDISSLIVTLLKGITGLGEKLYDALTYKVDLSWVTDVLGFLHSDLALPNEVSILGLLLSVGAIPLAIVIIYSIFKL